MNKRMTSEQLESIRKRAEAATEGPWERLNITDVFTGTGKENNEGVQADSNDGWQVADCAEGLTSVGGRLVAMDVNEKKANAEFIAHAREDIPKLLAEIERLKDVLGEAFSEGMRGKQGRVIDIIEEWGMSND